MRRLWAAGTAIAMCLALGGLPALAQEPSGSPSEHPLPLVTSGTGTACTTVDRGTRGTSDGLVQAAEEARGQTFDAS